jgi:hypothetical protein
LKEKANYITCPKGHKVFVIWSNELQRFGFTCDECNNHSLRAVSIHGTIEVTIVRNPFVTKEN